MLNGRENREENFNYNLNVIVCLLGPDNSGKSTLLQTYLGGEFTQKYQGTIGAAFNTKEMEIEGEKFNFVIWDIAEHENYFQLIPLYSRDAQALVGCFDLADYNSFKRLNEYIEYAIKTSNNDPYLYVVGMKSDLIDKREVPQQEIDSYVEKIKVTYVETSAVNNNKLGDILKDIDKGCL